MLLLLVALVASLDAQALCYGLGELPPRGPSPCPRTVGGRAAVRLHIDALAIDTVNGHVVALAHTYTSPEDPGVFLIPLAGGPWQSVVLRDSRPRPTAVAGDAPLAERVLVAASPPGPSVAVVESPAGAVVVTRSGIWRVRSGEAEPFESFLGVYDGTSVRPGPSPVSPSAAAAAVDAQHNLWIAGERTGPRFGGLQGSLMFSADPARWGKPPAPWDRPDDRTYPRLYRWRGALGTLAGDALKGGVWVYGPSSEGDPDLAHVAPSMAGARADVDPPSAVPEGVAIPRLLGAVMAAGRDGRVWLAGDTLGGSRVYVFDGTTFSEVTPANDLLKGRRFTQLLMAKTGELYAATDGVGVLVYDGKAWREHPVNADLPTLEGTGIKPVSCIDLDPNLGYLWVGTDNNVICWRPDEQP